MKHSDIITPYKVGYQHALNPEAIIKTAVKVLGEDIDYVIWRAQRITKTNTISLKMPNAGEWLALTDLLGFDCDAFTTGYHRIFHLYRVWGKIKEGTYSLRLTKKIEALLSAMIRDEDNEQRQSLTYYGDPLLSRIRNQYIEQRSTGFINEQQYIYWEKSHTLFLHFTAERKETNTGLKILSRQHYKDNVHRNFSSLLNSNVFN